MANCNSILSIHDGMGTTQNDRFNAALQPEFFLLEERTEEDFIIFVQKLSHYVKFYNGFNVEDGNWSNFFEKESTAILILIADWNIELLQQNFESKKHEILLNTDLLVQKQLLKTYFSDIEKVFNQLLTKTQLLDNDISEKENLTASSYSISNSFENVASQIDAATNIESLFQHYAFLKAKQQLFGLLLSWKNFSQNAVDYQLNFYAKHTPHYALFLSFLKLLKLAKDQLNGFTKNHLDFYYRDVLQVQTQIARPDFAHLVITPSKDSPFLLPKNTIFLGGKNGEGQKKYFTTTADQSINGIKINSILGFSKIDNRYLKTENLLPFSGIDKGFNVFKESSAEFQEGLMIASPLFFLQSGDRTIAIKLNGKKYNAEDFKFFLTGEENTLEIVGNNAGDFIALHIPSTEKKIIPFDKKIHPEFFVETNFPVLKIIPKDISVIPTIDKIELNIAVNNFKSYVLDSDLGTIDTEKPFYPFGEFPKSGNGITLKSNEFFMKKNAKAYLKIIAEGQDDTYFRSIIKKFFLLDGSFVEFSINSYRNNYFENKYPIKNIQFDEKSYDENTSNGKFRVELHNSEFNNEKFLETFVKASSEFTTLPYKPKAKAFIFDYTASETIDLKSRANENNSNELFQVLPYGFLKIKRGSFYFTKMSSLEGAAYLGFEKAQPEDALTFLIQLEEGSSNPLLEPAKISWSFLSENKWVPLDQSSIGDETLAFTKSGLVSLTIPESDSTLNTILSSDLFWLKISISNIQAVSNFLGIHTQALKVVLVDHQNFGTEFLEITPKGTISKMENNRVEVKKIIQPYASFSGKLAEKDESLYQRTSERLRHKSRAITSWDYERIILEEFPEVFRVKTLNHYRYDTKISNTSAGFVTLIPFAKTSNTQNISWKPMLSLNKMTLIKKFLSKISSPHVRLNVKPPKLEKVEVQFKVKFHKTENMDVRLYISTLTDTINRFLSPWAFDNVEFNFANSIEFSSIIQLIDNQYYVDYITDFKISQYLLDENNNIVGNAIQNLEKITPQTDFTLFIPNETYPITEI